MTISVAGDSPDWAQSTQPGPVVPNLVVAIIEEHGGPFPLLAAPSAGAWYLFGCDISSTGGGGQFNVATDELGDISYIGLGPNDFFQQIEFGGLRVPYAIYCNSYEIDFSIVLRYAAGP